MTIAVECVECVECAELRERLMTAEADLQHAEHSLLRVHEQLQALVAVIEAMTTNEGLHRDDLRDLASGARQF